MVSVAMSFNAQSAELLQALPQQGPTRTPQRSYSWTQEVPLPPNDNTPRRASHAAPAPKPFISTFWKNSGQVPGSVKAIKTTTPPRAFQSTQTPATPNPPVTTDSANSTNSTNSINNSTNATHTHDINNQSPPKPQPSSENSSPENSPSVQRLQTSASRSKSTSSIPERTLSSSSSSIGFGEFVHHCMEWKSCGRVGDTTRLDRFNKILSDPVIDMENLKKNSWKGIPAEVRSQCWKLLLGYLPANADRRESTLARKRQEYHENVSQYYRAAKTDNETAILKQIQIDLPRTNPKMPLFQQIGVQQILERVLYVWAIRHPASDYVQGINDIATPFFVVFLSEFVDNVEAFDCSSGSEFLSNVEADSYWCLSKFLDGIQDYYTFSQPGIQRMTFKLQELVGRVDQPLTKHLQATGMQFIDFSFRWMNCVLVREFPLALVARMWDTYLAEGESFSVFHLYVCAAFLKRWSAELRLLDFQELFMFLQRPPTNEWTCKDVELMLSEAYLWMETFQNAPAHLKSSVA